jgi:hypothetical protein
MAVDRLETDELSELKPLYGSDTVKSTLLGAALEGGHTAEVWVDSRDAPANCALRSAFLGATYIAGTDQGFLNEAISLMRTTGDLLLIWFHGRESCLCPPTGIVKSDESVRFGDRAISHAPPPKIPEGCRIQPIDDKIAERCPWEALAGVCNSPGSFHCGANGYALMREDEVLCEGSTPFWAEGHVELAVVTPEKHRGKGYAYLTCEHLARACENTGYSTVWHTGATSTPSICLAKKLGFQSESSYPVYHYKRT